ncbi:outer membrane beta-barrel protein [Vibrio owensii]|uniref:outer membrane beta-barrel protein n=1 Tax=Vibrio owensii TaxID=696485 RepID=UPI0038CD816B
MSKLSLTAIAALTTSMLATPSLADIYVGGKLGYSALSDSCHLDKNCDNDSMGAALHLGYDFNDYVALEYGVDYLGSFKSNFNTNGKNTIDGKLSAITLAPKFNLSLNDSWDVFAKLGAAYMISGDEKDLVPTASVGVEYQINYNWDLRAEYQRYQNMYDNIINSMDANFFGVGFNYRFGNEPVIEEQVIEVRPAARIIEHVYPAQVETIHFSFDSDNSEAKLANTIEILKAYPQAQVEITGYTDSVGSSEYNLKLSEERALSVADNLIEKGIEAQRMTYNGMGEENPVESNETENGREANRRVEVVIPTFKYQMEEKQSQ